MCESLGPLLTRLYGVMPGNTDNCTFNPQPFAVTVVGKSKMSSVYEVYRMITAEFGWEQVRRSDTLPRHEDSETERKRNLTD
jgi:hypothetical protein